MRQDVYFVNKSMWTHIRTFKNGRGTNNCAFEHILLRENYPQNITFITHLIRRVWVQPVSLGDVGRIWTVFFSLDVRREDYLEPSVTEFWANHVHYCFW